VVVEMDRIVLGNAFLVLDTNACLFRPLQSKAVVIAYKNRKVRAGSLLLAGFAFTQRKIWDDRQMLIICVFSEDSY